MHRATVLYDINGTTAEVTLEGPWIASQTFNSGNAIIYIKDSEDGIVRGTFEARRYYIIRIDRMVKELHK